MQWEIIDDKGTIHSGTEEEMRIAFDQMCGIKSNKDVDPGEYAMKWEGDLKLIQIHSIYR